MAKGELKFQLQTCCYYDGKELFHTQAHEPDYMREGINIVRGGETLKIAHNTILNVEQKGKNLILRFFNPDGDNKEMQFDDVTKIEIYKIYSILSIVYKDKYVAVNTQGNCVGIYDTISIEEEEEHIVGETGDEVTVLANIQDR